MALPGWCGRGEGPIDWVMTAQGVSCTRNTQAANYEAAFGHPMPRYQAPAWVRSYVKPALHVLGELSGASEAMRCLRPNGTAVDCLVGMTAMLPIGKFAKAGEVAEVFLRLGRAAEDAANEGIYVIQGARGT